MIVALVFVAAPRSWMQYIHALVDLGEMPDTPIVWYLARSTSAFYAMTGGLFWIVSFDIYRHQSVLWYLGWMTIVFGAALCLIDAWAAMPLSWTMTEGPFVMLTGGVVLYLVSRITHATIPLPAYDELRPGSAR